MLIEENALDFDVCSNIFFLEKFAELQSTLLISLSTLEFVKKLDKIIMLENGKIIEMGNPKMLILDIKSRLVQHIAKINKHI